MRTKLANQLPDGTIHVNELKEGVLAVITYWAVPDYVGHIVQRYKTDLVGIGNPDMYWSSIFTEYGKLTSKCRVRPLESGELIEVVL